MPPHCPARLRLEPLEARDLPSADFRAAPVVPVISAGTKDHLRAVLAQGVAAGNQVDVFAKVGDSITLLPQSFVPLGSLFYNPADPAVVGTHTDVAGAVRFFRARPVGPRENSFSRSSLAV